LYYLVNKPSSPLIFGESWVISDVPQDKPWGFDKKRRLFGKSLRLYIITDSGIPFILGQDIDKMKLSQFV